MLKFENVVKKFPSSFSALEEISFEIKNGDFVFIIGPSGAGKTTILRLIIKELVPTRGTVFFEEKDLKKLKRSDLSKLRQKIGMVFQDFRLLIDRTVFENVALPLEIKGLKEAEIKKQVEEALGLTGLSDKANFFPIQLSGGEMQRTALARAVVAEPKILLADEPTGNLDPKTGREILKLLQKINEMGTTVIMATHNADLVNSLKKRVILLDKGKIIKDKEEGKYEEID